MVAGSNYEKDGSILSGDEDRAYFQGSLRPYFNCKEP
jgi:hypothetical protein